MKNIYIVGSINTDLVINTPILPQKGETIMGNGFFMAHGGKGANQAIAAARLGGRVIMCGAVGNDIYGKEAIASLKKENIDVQHVKTIHSHSTGTAMIIVNNGDNRIILDSGANLLLTKEDIDQTLKDATNGDIYLTQLENPIDIIGYGLQKAKEKGLYVVLNPAPANKAIFPYLQYCDLIIPNETEIQILGGKECLLEKVKIILTTLGDKGFEITTKDKSQKYDCIKIKAIDTTAAGDTLCGGLVASIANGNSLEEAAKFGSLAASIACLKKGAQPSIPTKQEVITFFSNNNTKDFT